MKSVDELSYYTEQQRNGWHVGRCREFSDLRTKACRSALDAIDEIVTLTSERLREIDQNRGGFGKVPRTAAKP